MMVVGRVVSTRGGRASTRPTCTPLREHVMGHLTDTQRRVLAVMVLPVTIDEAAAMLGMQTRRVVETQWYALLGALGIASEKRHAVNRLAVARVAWGMDPCFCEPSR